VINDREALRVKRHELGRDLDWEKSESQCGLILEALRETAEEGPENRNAREGVARAQGTGKEKRGRELPKAGE
jgi:hypothetical protein